MNVWSNTATLTPIVLTQKVVSTARVLPVTMETELHHVEVSYKYKTDQDFPQLLYG